MKFRNLCTIGLLGLNISGAFAQRVSDALLFSDLQPTISARATAVGNAMGAIGGDPAALAINPAGLSVYMGGEFTLSAGLRFGTVNSSFAGEQLTDARTGFQINNLGLIMNGAPSNPESRWKNINVAFSLNRLASFGQDLSFSGVTNGSRLINYAQESQGLSPQNLDPFGAQLAYDTYLIDVADSAYNYVSSLTEDNLIRKSQFFRQSGNLQELGITMSGNFAHKFYIGGTLGIPFLKYTEFKSYEEIDETQTLSFQRMVLDENRKMTGVGVNFKLGAMYRINKFLRTGLHIHTPTIYRTTETSYNTMRGEIIYGADFQDNQYDSPTARYLQSFRTPWTLGASLAAVIKSRGFIGVDVEYLNFARNRFALLANDTSSGVNVQNFFNGLNDDIKNTYQQALRVRVGGELVLKPFRIRAGYNLRTSPYRYKVPGISDLRHDISFGVGVRGEFVFFDITYVRTLKQFDYMPYAPTSDRNFQQSLNNYTGGQIMFTFGSRW